MRIGQPIYWKVADGVAAFGIVTEVLPTKSGVIAVDTNRNKVVVKQPHKLREVEAMKQVLLHLKDLPEVAEFLQGFSGSTPTAPTPSVAASKPQRVKDYSKVFAAALAELDNLTPADKVRLNGMGVDVAGLPEVDDTATPIHKMYP